VSKSDAYTGYFLETEDEPRVRRARDRRHAISFLRSPPRPYSPSLRHVGKKECGQVSSSSSERNRPSLSSQL
jgi:hypothetical protein